MMKNKELLKMYKTANIINNKTKIITQLDIDNTLIETNKLTRGRRAILIHDSFDEYPQRFINCLNSQSYVQPHMHTAHNQWELMCWVSGTIIAVFFDHNGTVVNKIVMSAMQTKLIEIPPYCFHSFIAIEYGAYLEVRNCKYQPNEDRVYSTWSPPESSKEAKYYQEWLRVASIGDVLTINNYIGL